jgi:hypothetical protein
LSALSELMSELQILSDIGTLLRTIPLLGISRRSSWPVDNGDGCATHRAHKTRRAQPNPIKQVNFCLSEFMSEDQILSVVLLYS